MEGEFNTAFHRWWLDTGSYLLPALTEEQGKTVFRLLCEKDEAQEEALSEREDDFERRKSEVEHKLDALAEKLDNIASELREATA